MTEQDRSAGELVYCKTEDRLAHVQLPSVDGHVRVAQAQFAEDRDTELNAARNVRALTVDQADLAKIERLSCEKDEEQ